MTDACILLQRTTSKEQSRRLVAALLPKAFLASHGGAIVENHLNMIKANSSEPAVNPEVMTFVLNSYAADNAFRCISGSVAVSAFELQELPLPDMACMFEIARLRLHGADRMTIEKCISAAYGIDDAAIPA